MSEFRMDWKSSYDQARRTSPAVAMFREEIYLAFVANDETNHLLVASSSDGINWTGNVRIYQTSKTAPALTVFQDQLYLAFVTNNGSSNLRVVSSSDGIN